MSQRKPIMLEALSKEALIKLEKEQEYHIFHPHLKGIIIKIYYNSFQDTVIGNPVEFFEIHATVEDNLDRIHSKHKVKLELDELYVYVKDLLSALTKEEYLYKRILMEKGLKIGDIVEFQDGKQAVIVPAIEEVLSTRTLYYIPLKKDGTMSNHKPRILYGNIAFIKRSKEFSHEPY